MIWQCVMKELRCGQKERELIIIISFHVFGKQLIFFKVIYESQIVARSYFAVIAEIHRLLKQLNHQEDLKEVQNSNTVLIKCSHLLNFSPCGELTVVQRSKNCCCAILKAENCVIIYCTMFK